MRVRKTEAFECTEYYNNEQRLNVICYNNNNDLTLKQKLSSTWEGLIERSYTPWSEQDYQWTRQYKSCDNKTYYPTKNLLQLVEDRWHDGTHSMLRIHWNTSFCWFSVITPTIVIQQPPSYLRKWYLHTHTRVLLC